MNRACFPKEKHQNSQKWAKFMNFPFWPFLWFGLPGRLPIEGLLEGFLEGVLQGLLELSAPKSQRFLRLRCPSRTQEIAAILETRESNAALRFKGAMESR